MISFVYTGPDEARELWGCLFPRGEPVAVLDPALAAKCRALGCFDEIKKSVKKSPAEILPKKTIEIERHPNVKLPYDDMPGELRINVKEAKKSSRMDLIAMARRRGMTGVTTKRKSEVIKMLVEKYGELN